MSLRSVTATAFAHEAVRNDALFEGPLFDLSIERYGMQLATKNFAMSTIVAYTSTPRNFQRDTNLYPSRWEIALYEAWSAGRRADGIVGTTRRADQERLDLYLRYLHNPLNGFDKMYAEAGLCLPSPLITADNRILHIEEHDSGVKVRPATRDEIQRLFDYMDAEVERLAFYGKGAYEVYREVMIFRLIYAYGLRRAESTEITHDDLFRNIGMREFRDFGALIVRNGKGSRGSGPRRRTVFTDPLMAWIVPELERYLTKVRQNFDTGTKHLFVNVHGEPIDPDYLSYRFRAFADAAGIDKAVTLHSLRRSYITHMLEAGHSGAYVSDQVGHKHESTTAAYTFLSDDYRRREVRRMAHLMLGS